MQNDASSKLRVELVDSNEIAVEFALSAGSHVMQRGLEQRGSSWDVEVDVVAAVADGSGEPDSNGTAEFAVIQSVVTLLDPD